MNLKKMIKMKTKSYFQALVMMVPTLLLIACSNNDDVNRVSSQTQIIPYTVSVNSEASTRATVDADFQTLKFASGDKLYVSGTNISGVMDIQTGMGTASATFSGSLTYTGSGSPADNLALTATLVSAQQNPGTEVTVATDNTVTVNYGTALCADVNEAVQKYSLLTGTSTYAQKSFSLTQQTAFLNFAITLIDGTTVGTNVSATVANVGGSDRTGSISTIADGTDIVVKFVAPVAKQTLTNATIAVGGSSPVIFINSKELAAKVYHVKRTFHDLKKAAAVVPASGKVVVYQSDNANTTSNSITIGAGGELTLAGVNMAEASIICSGAATIIMADGSTNRVINSNENKCGVLVGPTGTKTTLKGENLNTGSLIVRGGDNAAGIGTYEAATCGEIEILSGNITAEGGTDAAGIGTGRTNTVNNTHSTCGNISISNGYIIATGGNRGAGIGSGMSKCLSTIIISGGNITATGRGCAAGIGGGELFNAKTYPDDIGWGDINIQGGTIIATRGSDTYQLEGYDIGAGGVRYGMSDPYVNSICGTVTISGSANITATNNRVKDCPSWPYTTSDIGKVIGANGMIYANATAASDAGTTAVAMIAYIGNASNCTHGLAISLADESGTMSLSGANTACAAKTTITGCTWRVPTRADWQYMFIGCGGTTPYGDTPGNMDCANLQTMLVTAGGTGMDGRYITNATGDLGTGRIDLGANSASFGWTSTDQKVRACLAF